MVPVHVGKGPELAGVDHRLDLVLHCLESRRPRLRVQRVGHIDVVKTVQVIEPEDVVVAQLCRLHHVAYEADAVGNRLHPQGVFHGAHRIKCVRGRADATDSLGELPDTLGVAAFHEDLKTAEHGRRVPGVRDLPVFDLAGDAQVAFNPGDGIDDYFGHLLTSFFGAVVFHAFHRGSLEQPAGCRLADEVGADAHRGEGSEADADLCGCDVTRQLDARRFFIER